MQGKASPMACEVRNALATNGDGVMLKKLARLPILAFIVLIEPLQAIAQQTQPTTAPQPPQGYYMPGPWHMWSDGYSAPFWWMFPIMMLFFFIICAVIVFFARGICAGGSHHWGPRAWNDPSQSALQILNERFARGEIQKDEYGERKATILSGSPR
jgi:putative membrane protein